MEPPDNGMEEPSGAVKRNERGPYRSGSFGE